MLKKSLILSFIALGLSGCTPTYEQYAKYKISDNDMKQVIAQYKNLLYCIHPESVGKSHTDTYNLVYRKISEAELTTWNYISYQLYINTIGQRDTNLMFDDNNSARYRDQKWFSLYDKVQPENNDYLKCGQKEKKEFQTEWVKPIEKKLVQEKKEKERQEKIAKAKAEKERQEREAYLKTPQGRMEAQQQAMMAQQRAMQQAQMAQQQQMHNDMMAQQRAMQQQQMQMQQEQMWNQQFQYQMQQMQKAGENIGRGWAW